MDYNNVIIKFVENTPVLAVLTIYILLSLRAQDKRDTETAVERQKFIEAYQSLASSMSTLNDNLRTQADAMRNSIEMTTQAHQYQRAEHEQMLRYLEKLNGKNTKV